MEKMFETAPQYEFYIILFSVLNVSEVIFVSLHLFHLKWLFLSKIFFYADRFGNFLQSSFTARRKKEFTRQILNLPFLAYSPYVCCFGSDFEGNSTVPVIVCKSCEGITWFQDIIKFVPVYYVLFQFSSLFFLYISRYRIKFDVFICSK